MKAATDSSYSRPETAARTKACTRPASVCSTSAS